MSIALPLPQHKTPLSLSPITVSTHNDAFRKTAGLGPHPQLDGIVHLVNSVKSLPMTVLANLLREIRDYDSFDRSVQEHPECAADETPGEHDFGIVGNYCFKIECYSDESLAASSVDPTDPDRTFRVMTITPLSEW